MEEIDEQERMMKSNIKKRKGRIGRDRRTRENDEK